MVAVELLSFAPHIQFCSLSSLVAYVSGLSSEWMEVCIYVETL